MESMKITAGEKEGYKRELFFRRDKTNTIWATWIFTEFFQNNLQWRTIKEDSLSEIHSIASQGGAVYSPKLLLGERNKAMIVWSELNEEDGDNIFYTAVSAEGTIVENAKKVFSDKSSMRDFSCDGNLEREVYLAAEEWRKDSVRIRAATFDGKTWKDIGVLPAESSYAVRPYVHAGNGSILVSWDEYNEGGYRVGTALLSEKGIEKIIYPEKHGPGWQNLSTLAQSQDGTWYLARSSDELIWLEGGALNHHSELRIAQLDTDSYFWHEIGKVNINYAMNPWMAAYMGRRRFPNLIPGTEGRIWLFWEEKEDPEKMDTGPGRLVGKCFSPEDRWSNTHYTIREKSYFIPEALSESRNDILFASKTQTHPIEQQMDFVLHKVHLDRLADTPAVADDKVKKPTFEFAQPEAKKIDSNSKEYRLLFGDPHIHSRFSGDLDGEPDELYHFARDIAKLDFVAFTENDCTYRTEPMSVDVWEKTKRLVSFFNQPGIFTTFLAYEYTKSRVEGDPKDSFTHRCVIFPDMTGRVVSWHDGPKDISGLFERFKNDDVIFHHHHDFPLDLQDDPKECNVEICSGWGNWMIREKYLNKVHELLKKGLKFGFIGGGDCHERIPGFSGGLTGMWARANTREDIYQALQKHRTFATTGLRPVFLFSIYDSMMGETVELENVPELKVTLKCESKADAIEFIRDGEIIHSLPCAKNEIEYSWEDESCAPGNHFYYVHIRFEGEEPSLKWNLAPAYGIHAWSSPIWVLKR